MSLAEAIQALTDLGVLARCSALAAGDEVERSKPWPDLYLLAASRLGLEPDLCLALEDSVTGCASARAAGMTTIVVPSEVFSAAHFDGADFVFESLNQVAAVLDDLIEPPVA